MTVILGLDIGGVNTKAVRLDADGTLHARSRSFELQREPDALVRVLTDLASELGCPPSRFTCALTMTAELSQMFRTKRDGVAFVLDALSSAFPDADVRVFTTDGTFHSIDAARETPLAVAAANWAATAQLVAERFTTALLIDVGTTTTDIIPVVDGRVVASGRTDPDRLASGELVYTGALRTPAEAIVREVPYRGGRAAVSAEGFALIGDAHLWRGRLTPEDYTVPTPDGRAASRELAGERLARVVCADRDMLDESAIASIADAIADEQVETVAAAIRRVRSCHPSVQTAVVTGLGDFIARDAARAAGIGVVPLANEIGDAASRYAPAAAVALLVRGGHHNVVRSVRLPADHEGPAEAGHYDRVRSVRLQADHEDPAKAGLYDRVRSVRLQADNHVDLVIKVGGGLLATPEHLDRVLASIAEIAQTHRLLVVPGGGPFADIVREVDRRIGLGDSAAHWMAVLAMDQYAHLLASRLHSGIVISDREQICPARHQGRIPILAPSRWLTRDDPLPHSWEITSDSIAAWIAGQVVASRLVLVKPAGAEGTDLVDPYFQRLLPPDVKCECLPAGDAIDWFRQQTIETVRSM